MNVTHEEAVNLLEEIKKVAQEVNDARKVEILDYVMEVLCIDNDMRNS